jgi:hypothetical protein
VVVMCRVIINVANCNAVYLARINICSPGLFGQIDSGTAGHTPNEMYVFLHIKLLILTNRFELV